MLIPVLVFIAGAGAVFAIATVLSSLPARLAQRRLEMRLRDVSTAAPEAEESADLVKRAGEGPLPAVDRLVQRTGAGSWLARLIEQSGTKTSSSAVLVMMALGGIAGAVTIGFAVRLAIAPVFGALVGGMAPIGWLMHRRGSRLKKFEEQFPEALDLLSRAIRAGHAFQSALGMVADEMREPVGPEFKRAFEQQNYGLPLKEALTNLAERMPLLDVRFFVTAVVIQRETGGNLASILDNLAYVVRERFKIQRQIRVHTAHGRFTGWVLMALPAALGVALSFINPEHMNLLFHEHMGQTMLMGAIVMQTVGFLWIRQVIKIEV